MEPQVPMPQGVLDEVARVENVLEAVFEAAEDAVCLFDGPRLVDCNPAAIRLFECGSIPELIERGISLFPSDERRTDAPMTEPRNRPVEAALEGVPQKFESSHRLRDGSEVDTEARVSRLFIGGKPFLVAIIRDVTAGKREAQMCERLIDSLPGSFFIFDSALRLRRWNKNVEQRSGFTPDELRGRHLREFLGSDEDRARTISAAKAVLETGDKSQVEADVVWKDGTRVRSVLTGARVDTTDGPMLVGIGIDVSARVRAEKALAMTERSYRALFDATHDALFVYDEDGATLNVNEPACALFGFDASGARSLTIQDSSLGEPPYSQREAMEKIRLAIREGPQVFEWRSRRRDGTTFWSEVALRAFSWNGKCRIIASVRDIGNRKAAALERERLVTEAQAALGAKDDFLAVLSHELRNPLAAIQAGADVLHHGSTTSDPAVPRAIDVIGRNVKLQARLVDDLLDLSRIVGGKLVLERKRVALDEIAQRAVERLRADAARAGVSLEAHGVSGIWVDADESRIEQVLFNLIDNGLKFTPRGGRVTVSTAPSKGAARIVVEDNGMGIAPERLVEIFDMFRQGKIATQRAPGLGVGLALVKSIAELHGGRAWAESEGAGRGSRFTVELPLLEPVSTATARQKPSPRVAPFKVLLVEDNHDTRALLSEALSLRSYDVTAADSGESALDVLSREAVDVIVADIGLPGMNGYDFLRKARALPLAAHTPAFALTGYGSESDVRQARDAGFAAHATKPLDVAALDRMIRSRLEPESAPRRQ